MNKLMKTLILSASSLFLVGYATATDMVNISVTGRITATPCMVDTDSITKQVDMGQTIAHNLNHASGIPVWKDFQLLLVSCPRDTHWATATFSGEADSNDPTAFKNLGAAENVALQMTNTDHSVIYSNASQMKVAIDDSTRRGVFPLSARIVSPSLNATGGSFNAAISVTFTYQ